MDISYCDVVGIFIVFVLSVVIGTWVVNRE